MLDLTTGKVYLWHPHQAFDTGSIVKVQIMGAVLHLAQVEHRSLTSYERDNMVPMIEQSDNDAATRLWNEVGGTSGVGDFDDDVGMSHTSPEYHWGLTTTTAPDNVKLIRTLVRKSSLYVPKRQQYALNLMEHVTDWQRWGVSAGPDEEKDATIALKNGWLPLKDERQWIINSMGWIEGRGRDYIIAVLTDENPSQGYGIGTVERISRFVWYGLK